MTRLTTEAVESTALPLEGVDNVEGGDSLPLRVLSVGDCVADDTFEEGLEDTASLFVDHCKQVRRVSRSSSAGGERTGRDTLDTATAGKTTDGGLRDTLDVVAQNLPVALGTALSKALATFAACEREVSTRLLFVVDQGHHDEDANVPSWW